MQGFNQAESAYTATAKAVVFSAGDQYDVAKLDNPVRKKVNYAIIAANVKAHKELTTL